MESTLPPDPYQALGVSKDADAAAIKAVYRKLVLKCHPDKVTDEELKKKKAEEFHKIQQAYEILGDEEKRKTYEAEVKLDQLRREKLARAGGAPNPDVKTPRYDARPQAPFNAAYATTTQPQYSTQEHRPSTRYEDDRHYDDRSRKYDPYDRHEKTRSSRSDKEPTIRVRRVSPDRKRSDHKKTRDREDRRDRSTKYHVESDSSADEKQRYETAYKRRSDEEEARKPTEARRRGDDRRSYDDQPYDRQRKLNEMASDAARYIHRSKVDAESRPSPSRTSSSRDVRPDHYESRSSRKEGRPEAVRRSSARTKERTSSSGRDRDRRGMPEIVEWDDDKYSSFQHPSSSPSEIHVPRGTPQRAYTDTAHRPSETSPTPVFRRSETMPSVPHSSSSRRPDAKPARPSHLRSSETVYPAPRDVSPEPTFPTVPPPQQPTTTKYYYTTSQGGVSLQPEDVASASAGHRTVLHEPSRHSKSSKTPLGRPPIGANRPVEAMPQYTTAAPKNAGPPPPLNRSATMNTSSGRGGEERRFFGEINSDRSRREKGSRGPENVSYVQAPRHEDIRWAARDRNTDREYASNKPSLGRTATYVY